MKTQGNDAAHRTGPWKAAWEARWKTGWTGAGVWFVLMFAVIALPAAAASKEEIDAKVRGTLEVFEEKVPGAKEIGDRAQALLVFPEILKAGLVVAGEYGEGALVREGQPQQYFSIASASVGFQGGVQEKALILAFMTQEALDKFLASDGWEVGVDGSVAIAEFGAGKSIDSNTLQQPVIGFVVSNKGLMAGVSIEGSKITPIEKN